MKKEIEGLKDNYTAQLEKYTRTSRRLGRVFNMLAMLRLLAVVSFLISGWFCINRFSTGYLIVNAASLLVFLILMKRQDIIRYKLDLSNALADINQKEIAFLETGSPAFDNGADYLPDKHFNAGDLDLFGEFSLFHHLNRTSTVMGRKKLAGKLLGTEKGAEITAVQQAVKELSAETAFRQMVQATGVLAKDSRENFRRIKEWCEKDPVDLSVGARIMSFAGPAALLVLVAAAVFTGIGWVQYVMSMAIVVNLLMLGLQVKKIKQEMLGADRVDAVLMNYSRIVVLIEQKKFASPLLNNLKRVPGKEPESISRQLSVLSGLFRSLESVSNLLVAFILNGLFQYHVHVLHSLNKWKKVRAHDLPDWLESIGEVEALSSLANFSANNPDYVFPELSDVPAYSFSGLGHPLIMRGKRVCNDIDFSNKRLVILTGSNMSGKSTFLRTLGVNLILARIGATVCASGARLYPADVLTSIQQSDSLNENESYFFAEVKKLKSVMDKAKEKSVFILLDEILRGTNSDDKRNGTVEVIRKLATTSSFGIIATHDLEICNLAKDFPGILANMCFEVEITDNDLHFDYTLRDGVCRNKSATFLMRKMEII